MPPHGLITEGGYRPLPPFWGGIGGGGGRGKGESGSSHPSETTQNQVNSSTTPPKHPPPPNPQISIPSPQKNNHGGEGGATNFNPKSAFLSPKALGNL